MEETNSNLPIIPGKKAIEQAFHDIKKSREVLQVGLLTKWNKLNVAMMGSWRFGKNYLLAGMSGSGKSYILNMIRKDFSDRILNANFKDKYRILHIAFEMSASDEIIRTVSSESSMSYQDILSSYKKLSKEDYDIIYNILKDMAQDPIVDYIEVTGNVDQIYSTIMNYQGKYPDCKLVISLDHTLLTEYKNEKTEIQLVTNLSSMFVKVRKKIGSMGLIVGQLNSEIEDPNRILKASLHYPVKRDIHGSKAIYRDADFVIVYHRPDMLNITRYGSKKMVDDEIGYPTKDIIFAHLLKGRNVDIGIIRYKQEFKKGKMIELNTSDYITINQFNK